MNMDWNKYQAEALTTAIYPLERELDYTILGLCSEVAEVAELVWIFTLPSPELKSEVGDCFWYVAAVADALKMPLQEVWEAHKEFTVHAPVSLQTLAAELVVQSGALAGLLKKAIRDDGGVLTPERRAKIVEHLNHVLLVLKYICQTLGTTAHAVTQANLNKLSDRKQRGVLQGSGDHR